jgi:hypothetical protein
MRTLTIAAVLASAAMLGLLTLSSVPVRAQSIDISNGGGESPLEEMMKAPEKQKKAEREEEYQKALKGIKPTGPANTDPWGDVRAADPKQAQKQKKPQ